MNQKEMEAAGGAVTPELLRVLDRAYPNRQPSINDNDRQIWIRVGHREVVDFLRHIYERENKHGRIHPLL